MLAVALVLLAAPALAAGAQTTPTTFGADLSALTPQSSSTCASLYFEATCTLSTSADSSGGTGESFVVPQGSDPHGSGTITAFHVKVGASTGQMQVLLMQALRRETSGVALCCSVVDATAVFTPAANATTTIPVQWATENDNIPNPDNNVYAFDLMAISVGSGVALPVASFPGAADTFWAPACPGTVGAECDSYGGDERYVVTLSASWTPGGTTPGGTTVGGATPHVALGGSTAAITKGAARVSLRCATARCAGTIRLQSAAVPTTSDADARAASAKTKAVTYGSATFSIAAGKTGTVLVKLDSAGRRLLNGRKRLRVYANATLSGGATLSKPITLER